MITERVLFSTKLESPVNLHTRVDSLCDYRADTLQLASWKKAPVKFATANVCGV